MTDQERAMMQSYSVNGVRMDLDTGEAIQQQMALGAYEPTESAWVRRHLGPGSVFVDVGANFGWFTTLALSRVGRRGHVFAFEPSPVAFATLKRALGSHSNVTLINAAVGREPGEITIYLPNSGPVHSPSVFATAGDFRGQRVPLTSLDRCDALKEVPVIDMVKIDVEGSEPDVVEGMRDLIAADRIRRVLCEFNSGSTRTTPRWTNSPISFEPWTLKSKRVRPGRPDRPATAGSSMSKTCCIVIAVRLAPIAISPGRERCSTAR
jgi:FkbM family methyltransferase